MSQSPSKKNRMQPFSGEIILVDPLDRAIGTMEKLKAHRTGCLHRALSIILHDGTGRILLQKRARTKYHSASLWTNTCCSHPRPGEEVLDAATRRLKEEMGIACSLTPAFTIQYAAIVSNGLFENEFVHVFKGQFNGLPMPNPTEVADWRWENTDILAQDIAANGDLYTPWFRIYCARHWDRISARG
jgi:isopentenyl-diphosphate Delta-isomerase